jgi:hypothetical protein
MLGNYTVLTQSPWLEHVNPDITKFLNSPFKNYTKDNPILLFSGT